VECPGLGNAKKTCNDGDKPCVLHSLTVVQSPVIIIRQFVATLKQLTEYDIASYKNTRTLIHELISIMYAECKRVETLYCMRSV